MQRRTRFLIKESESFECTNEKTNSNLVCDVSGYDCCANGVNIPVRVCFSYSTSFNHDEWRGLHRTHRNPLHIDRGIQNKPTWRGGNTVSLFVESCGLLCDSGVSRRTVLRVTGACSKTKRIKK